VERKKGKKRINKRPRYRWEDSEGKAARDERI